MLNDEGHQAEHVVDVGLGDAPDRDIWRYTLDHDAVIITKDEDFPNMQALTDDAPVIVWVRLGNTRRRALIERFQPLIDPIVEMIEAGNRLVELR